MGDDTQDGNTAERMLSESEDGLASWAATRTPTRDGITSPSMVPAESTAATCRASDRREIMVRNPDDTARMVANSRARRRHPAAPQLPTQQSQTSPKRSLPTRLLGECSSWSKNNHAPHVLHRF